MSLKRFLAREAPNDRVDITLFIAPSKILVGHLTRKEAEPATAYLAISYRDRKEYRLIEAILTDNRTCCTLPQVAHEDKTVQVVYSVSFMTEALHELLSLNKALRALRGRIRRLAVVSTASIQAKYASYRVFRRCAEQHQIVELRVLGVKGGMQRFSVNKIDKKFQTFVD